MHISEVIYEGNLRTSAIHLRSGNNIITDAPVDNKGKGEAFSPTDMVATSLASCMLTIIGIAAREHGFSIDGTIAVVDKIMCADPRRIGEIRITLSFPPEAAYSDKQKRLIKKAADTCPVAKSLHPELKQIITFKYQ